MDPVKNISVNSAAYVPKPMPNEPAPTKDGEAVSKVVSIPVLPQASIKEFSQDVKQAAEKAMVDIEHFISSQARSVRISKDSSSGHMVVQLVDPNSGEVIRTLPSEELLRLARTFETLGNVMVNQRA
jgi:flagellar protein FlaG